MDAEPCSICNASKEAHLDPSVNHEHNLEGQLVPKKKKPTPMRAPAVSGDTVLLRMIGVLAEKGIFTQEDLARIFPPAVNNANADNQ